MIAIGSAFIDDQIDSVAEQAAESNSESARLELRRRAEFLLYRFLLNDDTE